MGQHGPFGFTGGARGVDQRAQIRWFYFSDDLSQIFSVGRHWNDWLGTVLVGPNQSAMGQCLNGTQVTEAFPLHHIVGDKNMSL